MGVLKGEVCNSNPDHTGDSKRVFIPNPFMGRDSLPSQKSPRPHRQLSFAGLRFHGLGCGKFPISVWLGARGTRMQFTSLLDRRTTSRARHG